VKPKLAVYAGYFDPFTLGHLNIVRRADRVFDEIVVAIAEDSPKQGVFTCSERTETIRKIFKESKKIRVENFSGLLVNYMKSRDYNILIRGIRTVSDFEYEYQMALANKTLAPEVETFFMMTEGNYSYLSSTIIKEIARLGGDISSMVPPEVAKLMKEKYAKK
jgi:pantetheine-phosphate adenylyltransferase